MHEGSVRKSSWQRLCHAVASIHTRLSEWADRFGLWNVMRARTWKERGRWRS